MDIGVRQETLNVRGAPVLLQIPVAPCYALTTHKTQALSIRHRVNGILEGRLSHAVGRGRGHERVRSGKSSQSLRPMQASLRSDSSTSS
jgi:hypothetical protein